MPILRVDVHAKKVGTTWGSVSIESGLASRLKTEPFLSLTRR